MKLTDGKTLTYRIIGINHDDPAGGSGKAGLTFLTTTTGIWSPMNAIDTNAGGWDKSELRTRLNSGDLWLLLPSELQSKVKPVTKTTDNVGGNGGGAPSATTDKVFLLSATEVYGDMQSDGIQYECYKSKGVTRSNYSGASGYSHWTRSVRPRSSTSFRYVQSGGICYSYCATDSFYVLPAFCF